MIPISPRGDFSSIPLPTAASRDSPRLLPTRGFTAWVGSELSPPESDYSLPLASHKGNSVKNESGRTAGDLAQFARILNDAKPKRCGYWSANILGCDIVA